MPIHKTPTQQSAIVIGGGLVGLACAINLQRQGLQTLLLDPVAVRRAASWGNAGHIAVEQVEPLASWATIRSFPRRLFSRGGAVGLPPRDIAAWLPFSLRLLAASRPQRFRAGKAALSEALAVSLPAWRRLLAAAQAPELLREEGHFILWESAASAAAGRASWSQADTGTTRFRDATPDEMSRLSQLTKQPIAGAIRFEGSGHIEDLGQLADRLATAFEQLGGVQRCAAAQAVTLADGRAAVVVEGGEAPTADAIVVAAGVESARLLAPLGNRVPIIAERGYHIQASGAGWPADLPPVVFEDRSMIVTRFRSGLRAASFVEFGRSASPPDPRKWDRLRSHVRELGLPFAEPVSQWIGCRPTLPDYLPAIGRSRHASNLFYAFGHQHLGLTLAAATGEAVASLVTGGAPEIGMAAFSLDRF